MEADHYLMPKSLDEAFDLIEQYSGRYRLVAGATDIIAREHQEQGAGVPGMTMIDVSGIQELIGVELRGEQIRMGANTTFSQFLSNPILREQSPLMMQCAIWFADIQIREVATLGGNIINASPAADGVPPIMAMNGIVVLERKRNGGRETRRIPLADFITGPGSTLLEPGEIMTGIQCDALKEYGCSFEKAGPRRSLFLSTVSLAALVWLNPETGCFADVRLALGAVGPIPVRLTECEDFLIGKPVEPHIIKQAAAMPLSHVKSRTRQDYRRHVVSHFVEQGLTNALAGLKVSLGESRDIRPGRIHG